MRVAIAAALILFSLGIPAAGQTFTNLDFESAKVEINDPRFGFLDWNLAVPGWNHSRGLGTEWVYYGSEHLGLNQYYLLLDSNSPAYAPNTQLAGAYSLALASGTSNWPPDSTWVFAWISQTGTVPSDARSLRLLARGPFRVFVAGQEIRMRSLGSNAYAGDVVPFAGAVVEVMLMNSATNVHEPTVVDNIMFSRKPAPSRGRGNLSPEHRPRRER
jgi:hypothetical protein